MYIYIYILKGYHMLRYISIFSIFLTSFVVPGLLDSETDESSDFFEYNVIKSNNWQSIESTETVKSGRWLSTEESELSGVYVNVTITPQTDAYIFIVRYYLYELKEYNDLYLMYLNDVEMLSAMMYDSNKEINVLKTYYTDVPVQHDLNFVYNTSYEDFNYNNGDYILFIQSCIVLDSKIQYETAKFEINISNQYDFTIKRVELH